MQFETADAPFRVGQRFKNINPARVGLARDPTTKETRTCFALPLEGSFISKHQGWSPSSSVKDDNHGHGQL